MSFFWWNQANIDTWCIFYVTVEYFVPKHLSVGIFPWDWAPVNLNCICSLAKHRYVLWRVIWNWKRLRIRSCVQILCSDLRFSELRSLRMSSFGMIQIQIRDPRSLGSCCIKGTGEFVTRVDSSVPFMHHDPRDLGSLIRIRITPKERTLRSWCIRGSDKSILVTD